MKHSVQEAEKQKGEEIKGEFHNRKYTVSGPLPHFILCRPNNICNVFGDKGEKTGAWVCSLSLFTWFQFSLIAGNLVFNIN